MRILIETENQSAPVSPAVTATASTTDAGSHDAGAAPPDTELFTAPTAPTSVPATDAGGPPDWLVAAIESMPGNQSGNATSNGTAGIDGGQGL